MAEDVKLDTDAFDAGLRRLVDEIHDQTPRGLGDGLVQVRRSFEARAKVLTGEYKRSWKSKSAKPTGDGYEAEGGPDVPYARKQERKNKTVENALKDAERRVGNALEDAWGRPIS